MTPLLTMLVSGAAVAFWICGPLAVIGGLGMVLSRKAVHSALFLALTMVNLGVIYASQDAPFLFVVQIIVYTGAIMMLFLFVVMLVGVDRTESAVETIKNHRWASIAATLGFAILVVAGLGQAITSGVVGLDDANTAHGGNVQGIAALLFNRYVFAFEATAALLITAAVGAMVLAHGERLRPKPTQKQIAEKRMADYAATGAHPGAGPNPGVFARHNSILTPALRPDGSVEPASISQTLLDRAPLPDHEELSAPTRSAFAELEAGTSGKDEEE